MSKNSSKSYNTSISIVPSPNTKLLTEIKTYSPASIEGTSYKILLTNKVISSAISPPKLLIFTLKSIVSKHQSEGTETDVIAISLELGD